MRIAVIVVIAVAVFTGANIITSRALMRCHPRRRKFVIALLVAGNTMWPFLPLLNARTDLSRFVRATLGPMWFAWQSFAVVYAVFATVVVTITAALPRTAREGARLYTSRVFLWITIVASVIGFYDAVVPLRVEHVPVTIAHLPATLDGTRIALLGDLHVGLFTRVSRLHQFFATAGAEHPDVVIIAGDLIDDDPHFIPKLLRGTTTLDPRIPLLAVLGNHEMYGAPFEAIAKLRGSRIHLLVNEGFALRNVYLAGVSDFAARDPRLEPNFDRALANTPPGAIPIVIAHQPKAFPPAIAKRIPLTLVAHTHGGQLGFRPLRWSLAGLFLKYHIGLYREGASQLYVNTGTGYWLLPFRLGMTPEITLIELRVRNGKLKIEN
jgi:predicted MPP superfamily phosphohydrolase